MTDVRPIDLFHNLTLLPAGEFGCPCGGPTCCSDYREKGYNLGSEYYLFHTRQQFLSGSYPDRYLYHKRHSPVYPFGPDDDPNAVATQLMLKVALDSDPYGYIERTLFNLADTKVLIPTDSFQTPKNPNNWWFGQMVGPSGTYNLVISSRLAVILQPNKDK